MITIEGITMDIEKKCRTLAHTGVTFRYGPWHPSADGIVVMDCYGEQVARAASKEDCEALARAPEMAKALLEAADEIARLRTTARLQDIEARAREQRLPSGPA